MEQTLVKAVIERYINAFNRADVTAIVSLFAEDAVLMAPDAPTVEGREQLTAFMNYGFSLVDIQAVINFDEVVVNGDSAYVRTHSHVKVIDLKSGVTQPEEDRELFILRKDDGGWQISRYMFNKKPGAKQV
jgi:uncharacterized protein (TIGR02246 family)